MKQRNGVSECPGDEQDSDAFTMYSIQSCPYSPAPKVPLYTGQYYLLLKLIHLSTSVAQIYAALVVGGFGTGVFSQASISVAQSPVPPEEIPMAVDFMTYAQVGGSTIALAIANTVFTIRATDQITQLIPGESVAAVQVMISGANSAFLNSLDGVLRTHVLNDIVTSITNALTLDLTAGALAVVVAVCLQRGKIAHTLG